ncbi:hypothetical protein MNBD_GAMMA16-1743 [hydrothermal vent metagenome]|uniref:DUF4124 domain-containing protein n=1 Tax=hydrothermal vent metagenome TaxID=652676 RepID=A0A3B0ZY01_9ZZZZ
MANKNQTVFLLSLILAISPGVYGANLFKWVDKEGNTHFGDAIPAEYVKEQHEEISNTGRVTIAHKRAKTKEELRIAQEQKDEAERLDKERLARKSIIDESDRILLDTYLTEKDLTRTKDRRIATLAGTIRLTENNIRLLNKTIDQLTIDAKEHDNEKKILRQLKIAKAQLFDYKNFISKKKKEQSHIRTTFDQDLERFRFLKDQS